MKRILRKILPVSVFRRIKTVWRRIRYYVNLCAIKVKVLLHIPLKRKRTAIRFEVQLAEHCNLKCKACSNFSCIAEPEFADVEEFRKDMHRLGEIFKHECESILLIGGEPLLHPDINTFMQIARENFTKGNISVFTNGLLLPNMPPDFWKSCHDNNIGIIVSPYPIRLDKDRIRALAGQFGAGLRMADNRDQFYIQPVNLEGSSDVNVSFGLCVRANACISLSHGRMYTCTFAPNVRHFNRKFGTNVEITDADSIDIHREGLTADEILERLARPIPACRWCNLSDAAMKPIDWGITQAKIEEWT